MCKYTYPGYLVTQIYTNNVSKELKIITFSVMFTKHIDLLRKLTADTQWCFQAYHVIIHDVCAELLHPLNMESHGLTLSCKSTF